MAFEQRWMVLLTVDALPEDPQRLTAELPDTAAIFYSSPGQPPRTGIAFRVNAFALVKVATSSLNFMVDSLGNLGHKPVTSMQIFTTDQFAEYILPGDCASFTALLFGAHQTDLPAVLRGNPGVVAGALADMALDS